MTEKEGKGAETTLKSKFARGVYLCAIGTGLATFAFAILYYHYGQPWLLSTAISFGTTFYHFAMRLAVGLTVPKIRNYHSRWFCQRPFESKLYTTLKVKQWKKYAPTFDPRLFSLQHCTLIQIIENSCQAEVVHEIIILLSFLPILTIPFFGAAGVFICTSVVAALVDSIFVIMQRYNRPRLIRILEKETAHG